jgi:hypothetical protein
LRRVPPPQGRSRVAVLRPRHRDGRPRPSGHRPHAPSRGHASVGVDRRLPHRPARLARALRLRASSCAPGVGVAGGAAGARTNCCTEAASRPSASGCST